MQKRITLFTLSLFFTIHSFAQVVIDAKGTKVTVDPSKWEATGNDIYNKNTAGVGIGTAGAANSDAALEVKSTNKGVLIPRVALTSTTSFAPLSTHVAGMMVYNIATAGTAPNNVTPGFYYNDGNKWVKVADASNGDLTKDAWVDDSANTMVKLGTLSDGTTARPIETQLVVKDNGRVGIGTSNPSWMLDAVGAAAIGQFKRIGPALTNTQAAGFLFTRAAGSPGAEQNINVGDFLGKVQFRGRVGGIDKDFATFAYVAEGTTATIADGTSASNASSAGRFAFLTGPGNNVSRELMSINTISGNVGIGVTAPKSLLDIKGYARLGTADATADALTTAADRAGMIRYNSTTKSLQYHDDTQWITAASAATADLTNDAWVNDNANTVVKLGTLSNGTTTRPDSLSFVAKDNGKVGIGTAAPQAALHVKNGDFRLENEKNWNAYKGVTYSDTQYPQLFLFQARGTKASPTYPLSGTTLGVFRAANAIDSAGGAGFRVRSTENQSATTHGASTVIYTTPNGQSDNIDRFIVDHNGNVGIAPNIGSITARSRLYVAGYARVGTADATADALTTASDRAGMIRYNSTSKALQFHDDTQWLTAASTATADITNDAWVNDSSVGNTMVKLGTKSDGTTARDAGTEVVVKDDGRVGIGTASPDEKLHVSSSLVSNFLGLTNFFAPNNTTSGNSTMFRLGVSNTARNTGEYRFKYVGNGSTSNSLDFAFNGVTSPLMTIQAGGNVGIGTATPGQKLQVAGTVAATNYTTTVQAITGAWDLALGGNATWNLAAGSNTLTISNAVAGMFGMLKLVNTGSSSITLPAGSKVINNGGGAILLTQTASAVDILTFYYDGTNYWWTYGNNYN